MRVTSLIKTAGKSILRNRVRSLLTMLGIIIGVASVVVMVSIGEGAQFDIRQQIESMGTNVLTIRPGNMSARGGVRIAQGRRTLTIQDVDRLRGLPGVAAISPISRATGQIVGGTGNWRSQALGVTSDYLAIRSWELQDGVMFAEQDTKNSAKVAVVGKTVVNELFPNLDPVGQSIRIGSIPVKVIGVLRERGQGAMGDDQDDIVLLPVTTVMQRMNGTTRFIDQIMISTESMEVINDVQAQAEEALRAAHRLSASEESDFNIRNQSEMMERATETARVMTMLLGAIAGISLVVGGIGIMNIMLVSVTERTREIGIRMAVGAREGDILMQFLIEAIVLSVMGGLIGVALSIALIWVMNDFVGVTTVFAPQTILMSMGFSGFVGVFFGFYPARKAARLNPIQALRFE
ncbi:MAG: ABC transporter permease [Chitinispirillales bacterium]|jgi:putative ABC transport system permease protein|nr:ABC transporter permease [Chitinispirillales bacterium]